jgi:membrane-associated phospholipid phosphatase
VKSQHAWALLWLPIGLAVAFVFNQRNALGVEPLAVRIGREGNTGALVLALSFFLIQAWRQKDKALARWVVLVMLVETGVYLALKGATWGINIKHHTYGLALLPRPSGGDGGFPSGHTAAHVCLAYLLAERYPKLAPVWWFWAALMAWSRVEAGAHWAYQLVAGMVLGGTVCLTLGEKLKPPPAA